MECPLVFGVIKASLENVEVAKLVLAKNGVDQSSVLVGASVHNQRIERLWRDVFTAVTQFYHSLFHYMEHCNLLNPLCPVRLFALHFVYTPRINRALELFVAGWNSHSISKTGGQTPLKLYTRGMIDLQQKLSTTSIDYFEDITEEYGAEDITPELDSENTVDVPPIDLNLTQECMDSLKSVVDPLAESDKYGTDVYLTTLTAVEELVNSSHSR